VGSGRDLRREERVKTTRLRDKIALSPVQLATAGCTTVAMDVDRESRTVGLIIGGLGPIAVAAALVGVRGEIINANVALVLVVIVLIAGAVGGRAAGALGAVVAALSFDFFHTRPYLSLTIDSADDVETTLLLLVTGLLAGQIAWSARRAREAASHGRGELGRLTRIAHLIAGGDNTAEVILAAQGEIVGLLGLRSCRFEAQPYDYVLPKLERSGAFISKEYHYAHGGFELPAGGVELPVLGRGHELGRFVLEPTPGVGTSLEQRVVATAIADQVGAALAANPPAINVKGPSDV
jgi:hypothetical protein